MKFIEKSEGNNMGKVMIIDSDDHTNADYLDRHVQGCCQPRLLWPSRRTPLRRASPNP
jgi:hypothetical protein